MSAVSSLPCARQASATTPAISEFSPAVDSVTITSADAICSIKFIVSPASPASQPPTGCAGAEPPGARRNVAFCQWPSARRRNTRSLGPSSAMTLTARARAFGASMRKRDSEARVARADSLSIASHRRVRDAFAHGERLARALVERLILRQHDRRGAHALMRRIDAGRRDALLVQRLDRLQHAMPRHDDAVVGGDQILFRAVDDRAHALLQRSVLHRDAFDAAVVAAGLLRGAVDQVIVVLVGERAIAAGDEFDIDTLAVLHRLHFALGERTHRMIVEAPRPAVFVVNR